VVAWRSVTRWASSPHLEALALVAIVAVVIVVVELIVITGDQVLVVLVFDVADVQEPVSADADAGSTAPPGSSTRRGRVCVGPGRGRFAAGARRARRRSGGRRAAAGNSSMTVCTMCCAGCGAQQHATTGHGRLSTGQ